MTKSWRPEGFDKAFDKFMENKAIEAEIDSLEFQWFMSHKESVKVYKSLFEAGADALLEALRKRGFHVNSSAFFTSVGEHATLSNENNTGDYIFIPDDIWQRRVNENSTDQ